MCTTKHPTTSANDTHIAATAIPAKSIELATQRPYDPSLHVSNVGLVVQRQYEVSIRVQTGWRGTRLVPHTPSLCGFCTCSLRSYTFPGRRSVPGTSYSQTGRSIPLFSARKSTLIHVAYMAVIVSTQYYNTPHQYPSSESQVSL